jgi:hypothetical protein
MLMIMGPEHLAVDKTVEAEHVAADKAVDVDKAVDKDAVQALRVPLEGGPVPGPGKSPRGVTLAKPLTTHEITALSTIRSLFETKASLLSASTDRVVDLEGQVRLLTEQAGSIADHERQELESIIEERENELSKVDHALREARNECMGLKSELQLLRAKAASHAVKEQEWLGKTDDLEAKCNAATAALQTAEQQVYTLTDVCADHERTVARLEETPSPRVRVDVEALRAKAEELQIRIRAATLGADYMNPRPPVSVMPPSDEDAATTASGKTPPHKRSSVSYKREPTTWSCLHLGPDGRFCGYSRESRANPLTWRTHKQYKQHDGHNGLMCPDASVANAKRERLRNAKTASRGGSDDSSNSESDRA